MALFSLDLDIISRGAGYSITAAAAYRAGELIVDERTGEVHDYRRRSGVDGAEILAPAGAEPWTRVRATLWNRAELAERRRDAQLGRHLLLVLPRGLDAESLKELVREYVQREVVDRGMVADVAYHDLAGDNPHAHVLITLRELDGDGFAARKNRDWNDPGWGSELRKQWATKVNEFLARANVPREEWIDHRTLAAQREEALRQGDYERAVRLSRLPTRHRGKAATAIVARGGISTRVEDLLREVEAGAARIAGMLWEVEQLACRREEEAAERLSEAVWDLSARRAERRRAGRIEQIEAEVGGRDLVDRQLDAVDEGWRERGDARVGCLDRAVATAEMELVRIKARRLAAEERRLAELTQRREARLAAIESRKGGRDLFDAKLDELDPGWRVRGDPNPELADVALTNVETELTRIETARRAEEERRATERRERAEAAAREAGIDDVQGVYASARLRGEDEVTALDTATATTRKAELALLTDEQMEGIRLAAERDRKGSGWPALGTAVAERCERKLEAEDAARRTGVIDVEAEFAIAREGDEDPVARLVRVAGIVAESREALLTDDAIRAIHAEGELRGRGGGWTAVEGAAAERRIRKAGAESAAREVGIDDVDAVYAAALARGMDRLAALEEATAAGRRAERREARRRELRGRFGGREIGTAHLAALVPHGQEATEQQSEEALTGAESDAGRLDRAGRIGENRWSRVYYVAAAGALGDRFTLAQVDTTMTDAESFARSAGDLSEVGCALLDTTVEKGGEHLAVGEFAAALERAQEADRQEAERQRTEQRRARVAGREAAVRATNNGPGWLTEAEQKVLRGGDRQPTLKEREQNVGMVEERVREELDRRQEALRSTEHGTRFLDEVRGRAGAVKTLAEEEQLVDAAAERLREHQEAEARRSARKRELLELPGGEDVLNALLNGLDPRRSDRRETTVENFDKALTEAFSDRERLGGLRDVLADPEDAARYREALEARGRTFTIKDIDTAIEAVRRHRADAERQRKAKEARQREAKEARQREAEEARQREAEEARQREEAARQRKAEAEAERRQKAARKRGARLKRLFEVDGGDVALFAALDACKPKWRETGAGLADIDHALSVAERGVDVTKKVANAEQELVVDAEKAFPDAPSTAWRQAGGQFAASYRGRVLSQRLSDRAQTRALVAERPEPPAAPGLVRRLVDWLRAQVEKLLDRLLPAVRKAPEVLPPVRRRPEVLPPVRTKPRVRMPQPDLTMMVVSRAVKQHSDVTSSTWWAVRAQISPLDESAEARAAKAAARTLHDGALKREGSGSPPAAASDLVEPLKKWLLDCARQECERLGLSRLPIPVRPPPPGTEQRSEHKRTPGERYTPGE